MNTTVKQNYTTIKFSSSMAYTPTNTKWTIDKRASRLSFVVNHLMISTVKGCFKEFDASIFTNDRDFTSAKIDFWLDTSSIDTNDKKRDDHLVSSEFFNHKKHPLLKFVSDIFKKQDNNSYELSGNLTIKEVTKPIKLNVLFNGFSNDKEGNDSASFLVTGTLNRKHWKLEWDVAVHPGSILVSDEVLINGEITLVKQEYPLNDKTLLELEIAQGSAPHFEESFI